MRGMLCDVLQTPAGLLVADSDGTVRRLEPSALVGPQDAGTPLHDFPILVKSQKQAFLSLAKSADGKELAASGEGVLARSFDGGRTWRLEGTPLERKVLALGYCGGALILFHDKGAHLSRNGKAFIELPGVPPGDYMTAAFEEKSGFVVGTRTMIATTDCQTWTRLEPPSADLQGVAWSRGRLFVTSFAAGIFRSDDRGDTFKKVFTGGCVRLAVRGNAVVAGCSRQDAPFAYSADGLTFTEVRVPGINNLNAALIDERGALWGVGTWEQVVKGTPSGGALVSDTTASRFLFQLGRSEEAAQPAPTRAVRPEPPPEAQPAIGTPHLVRGTVRDSAGKPVPNVELTAVAPWAHHGEGYQATKSGTSGEFAFEPAQQRSLRLDVKADGFAPQHLDVAVNPNGERVVDFTLQREVDVAGIVISPEGPPRGWVTLRPPTPPDVDPVKWRSRTARVAGGDLNPDGSFRLKGVAPGRYQLEVTAPGFIPSSVSFEAPASALRISVRRGASLKVNVVDPGGKPVRVQLVVKATEETARQLAASGIEVFGFDDVTGLPDGEFLLSAQLTLLDCREAKVTVSKGTAPPIQIVIGGGLSIRGRVTDAKQNPVAGLNVLAELPAHTMSDCTLRVAKTLSDGTFALLDVSPSPYQLRVFFNADRSVEQEAIGGAQEVKIVW